MKKFVETAAFVAVVILVGFFVVRFGSWNMSRAAYEAAHYTKGVWHP